MENVSAFSDKDHPPKRQLIITKPRDILFITLDETVQKIKKSESNFI